MKRAIYILPILLIISLGLAVYLKPIKEEKAKMRVAKFQPIPTAFDSLLMSYDSVITNFIDSTNTVGAAVAVVHKDSIVFIKPFGVKDVYSTDSVDIHTVFRLASVSKAVTGVIAGILHQEHEVSLDDTVYKYINTLKLKNSYSTENLTARHLLSHTSGLVPHAYDNLVEDKVAFSEIMNDLQNVNISAEPGKIYGYQNVMFSIYDTLTEIKTGNTFKQQLKEKLFTPCGMKDASTDFKSFFFNNNKAFPHERYSDGYNKLPLNSGYYNTLPAAGVNASISDMAHLLKAIFINDTAIFPQNALDTVFTPIIKTPLRRGYFNTWGKVDSRHYGVGWRIVGYKSHTVAYHGGYVRGYRSEIALIREDNIGIVYLSNSPSRAANNAVPSFLKLYFKYKERQSVKDSVARSKIELNKFNIPDSLK